MQILERHSLEKDNRMLVLRHFAEDFKKVRAAGGEDDSVSREDPPLRAKDNIGEGVVPPKVLHHSSKVLLVVVPPQDKFFSRHPLFALRVYASLSMVWAQFFSDKVHIVMV